MAPRLLRRADHRRMPWKNGGGETSEIAAGPAGAGIDDFAWRVSLARVERDGPFSEFPGIDRLLGVVEGDGIDLVFGPDHHVPLTKVDPPHGFPGDVAVFGRLLGGPIVDLNVMTRRAVARARLARVATGWSGDVAPAGILLVYCHRGLIRAKSAEGTVTLDEGDAVLVEGPSGISAEVEGLGYRIDIIC